jgi:predicted nucleic acid-binding protein
MYHFTESPLLASSTAFLRRVEAGDIQGITSVVVLAEVAHRLMVLEAISTFGFASRTAVRQLKEHPALVQQVAHDKVATEKIPAFHVAIEPVTPAHLQTAQILSATHGLLTNAPLTAAVMQSLALTDLVPNDPDLSVMPGLTIWQPQR